MVQDVNQQALNQEQIEAEIMSLYGLGHFNEAATLAKALTQAHPENLLGWKALATIYSEQARHADTIDALQQAIQCSSADVHLYYNLGTTLLAVNRTSEAADALRQATIIAPDMVVAINNLGVALNRLQQIPEAMTYYQQAIQLQPSYAEAHNNLGESFILWEDSMKRSLVTNGQSN